MADTKITALQTPGAYPVVPSTDVLPIVITADNSMAASGSTRKVTVNQILSAGGTATLASATITGDLTVRTNQLVVNSSGSFVGKSAGAVGTDGVQLLASGFSGFSASATTALFVNRNTSDGTVLQLGRSGASAADFGAIAGGGFTVGLSGSEWMRLNATGLGVGVVPSAGKFEVQESGTGSGIGGIFTSTVSGGGNPGVVFRTASTNRWSLSLTGSAGAESIRFYDVNNSATRLTIDSSGNVGIGVTSPSYNLDVRAAAATANVQSSTGTNAVSIVARNTGGSFTFGKENSVGGGSGVFGQDAYASVLWSTGAYPVVFGTNGAHRLQIDSVGNMIPIIQTTAPTLTLNGQMVFNLTSNTNLRISVRGTDGVTRTANITLA